MAPKVMAAACFSFLLLVLSVCEARTLHLKPAQLVNDTAIAQDEMVDLPARSLRSGECATHDLTIAQGEISGVGLPTFEVRITNQCFNTRCSFANVIVQCGQFRSGAALNPKIIRRLDVTQGTCLINDGRPIAPLETIRFTYREIWYQPLKYRSARIVC